MNPFSYSSIVLLFLFLLATSAFAGELDHYYNRYELKLEENRITKIRDLGLGALNLENSGIMEFQSFITNGLEQATHLTGKGNKPENIELRNYIQSEKFVTLLEKFELELQSSGVTDDVLCRPHQKLYYWKNELGNEVFKLILSQILRLVPYANLLEPVREILNYYFSLKQEQIEYHRNVLRYYLESYNSTQLRMNESDRTGCLASLYDFEVSFWNLPRIISLTKNWYSFAAKERQKQIKKNAKRQKNWHKYFISREGNLGLNHEWLTTKKSRPVIVDWDEPIYLFFKKPSLIYFADKPNYTKIKRLTYRWLELTTRILPIPMVGSVVSFLTKLNYSDQVQNEALLIAHLESTNENELLSIIASQTGNPLITKSFGNK